MGLEEYRKKRKFQKTPEPKGKKEKAGKQLRFVVQKHDATRLHYDFRLEIEGVLKSWAIPKGPTLNPSEKKLALMTEDHPVSYINFEGVIPEGNYGAGPVIVWDSGTYRVTNLKESEQEEEALVRQLLKGHLSIFLNGQKLYGEFALTKFSKEEDNWLFVKKRDEYATEENILMQDESVLTDKTIEEISQKSYNEKEDFLLGDAPITAIPKQVKPMLSTLADKAFDDINWLFEVKWDGYRAIAEVEKGKVNLHSRNLISFNKDYFPVAESLKKFGHDVVLDGEIVVLDESGKSNFQKLQSYKKTENGTLIYYIFDLLWLDGHDLKNFPLLSRKDILRKIVPNIPFIQFSDHVLKEGNAFFSAAKKEKLEGIMAKKVDSRYIPSQRTNSWLKLKIHKNQEAIICGYTGPRGSRKAFGALVLGVYSNEHIEYIGHTGTGFDDKKLLEIKKLLEPLKINNSPFKKSPKTNMPVTWVKPEIVAEIKFTEWTNDNNMRHPIFAGVRNDLDPKEVKIEKAEKTEKILESTIEGKEEEIITINNNKQKLTNLNKIFWPKEKYTKGDLLSYYLEISDIILPYLKNRPQSLKRYPNGITGESFYQKNVEFELPEWIETVRIKSEHEKRQIRYFLVQNKESLIYLINLGCIDLNPWNSRLGNLDRPDYLVIDLDPEDISFGKVVEAALTVKKVLDEIGVESFPKTSGATGMHIYIPTGGKYNYEQIKNLGKIIATIAHSRNPKVTSIMRSPAKRQKKVYLDYLQNLEGQTLASAYSVRPIEKATVSAPLKWEEVNKDLNKNAFNIKTMPKRIEKTGDLFKPVLKAGLDLEKTLKKIEEIL